MRIAFVNIQWHTMAARFAELRSEDLVLLTENTKRSFISE